MNCLDHAADSRERSAHAIRAGRCGQDLVMTAPLGVGAFAEARQQMSGSVVRVNVGTHSRLGMRARSASKGTSPVQDSVSLAGTGLARRLLKGVDAHAARAGPAR